MCCKKDNAIYVFEGDTGEILKVTEQSKELVATVKPGSQPQSKDQPPSMVFNGLIIEDDLLYHIWRNGKDLIFSV